MGGMTGNTQIAHRFSIKAEPSLAYLALTEQHHFAKWWSSDSLVEKWIGGRLHLGALPHQCAMVVETLKSGEMVEWKCMPEGNAAKDECFGTTIRFQIARNEKGGTDVTFRHDGWKSQCVCFKRWSATWARLAGKSLKAYLETGLGMPVC
jgi:activator of Hsp90 ATPase-like protein